MLSSEINMFNLKGEIHYCYPYYKRFANCFNNSMISRHSCEVEKEDYLECWNSEKRKTSLDFLSQEMVDQNLMSIPYYDPIKQEYINEFDKEKLNKFAENLNKI